MDSLELLHVADIDIDPADVVHRAARGFDRGFDVLADLPGLGLDIADSGDRAVGPARGHPGDEDEPAPRLDRGRVRKDAARLAQFVGTDLLLRHPALSYD